MSIVNTVVSLFLLANNILFSFVENSISQILLSIWELFSIPITIFCIISIIILINGIIKNSIFIFSLYTGTVFLLVFMLFILPYIT